MAQIADPDLPNLAALLADEGSINVGYLRPVGQVAIASDPHQALAMLRRRPDEPLAAVLRRLDAAVATALEHGEFTDEINT
ncbi:hypothetical protein [Spiribacter vilamensis]|uniref:Uncharacterized protein n=1 Tax=Spiribacter vilamensis TaxID=531306 RepID=A0A4V2GIY2_9GAMM|nr:hypothetical protein [Spiribacter vilamensis]RZU98205.1 hypothetical protein EV698_0447 [Spiribacter vilamensis]TVO60894.1 hypothetical protein FPL09_01690 [Spiribacter vilamensis]